MAEVLSQERDLAIEGASDGEGGIRELDNQPGVVAEAHQEALTAFFLFWCWATRL